jgi:hypothetical protein
VPLIFIFYVMLYSVFFSSFSFFAFPLYHLTGRQADAAAEWWPRRQRVPVEPLLLAITTWTHADTQARWHQGKFGERSGYVLNCLARILFVIVYLLVIFSLLILVYHFHF